VTADKLEDTEKVETFRSKNITAILRLEANEKRVSDLQTTPNANVQSFNDWAIEKAFEGKSSVSNNLSNKQVKRHDDDSEAYLDPNLLLTNPQNKTDMSLLIINNTNGSSKANQTNDKITPTNIQSQLFESGFSTIRNHISQSHIIEKNTSINMPSHSSDKRNNSISEKLETSLKKNLASVLKNLEDIDKSDGESLQNQSKIDIEKEAMQAQTRKERLEDKLKAKSRSVSQNKYSAKGAQGIPLKFDRRAFFDEFHRQIGQNDQNLLFRSF